MTEDEAKTKWCFAAVASHTNPRQGFDGEMMPKVFPCIASACMAWRWRWEVKVSASETPTGVGMLVESDTNGYCGLAGKP